MKCKRKENDKKVFKLKHVGNLCFDGNPDCHLLMVEDVTEHQKEPPKKDIKCAIVNHEL